MFYIREMVSPNSFRTLPDRAPSASSGADLGAIRAFVAVATTGSFVAGGKTVGLTRSAVGKALARLEAHLGARLLHRTTRSVALTADGQLFFERCVQLLADLEDAEATIRQRTPHPRGTLRLTVADAFGRIVVLPVLRDYLEAWPDVAVEVNFTDRVVDLVEEGFDLGIRIGGLPPDSPLIARRIARSRPGLYAAPTYLARYGVPQTPEDLATHQRLVFGKQAGPYPWALYGPGGAAIEINGASRVRVDSGEAMRDAAVASMGIAFLPGFLANDDVAAGRLVTLLPDYTASELSIFAVYPNRKHLSARIRVFIDMLVSRLNPGDNSA